MQSPRQLHQAVTAFADRYHDQPRITLYTHVVGSIICSRRTMKLTAKPLSASRIMALLILAQWLNAMGLSGTQILFVLAGMIITILMVTILRLCIPWYVKWRKFEQKVPKGQITWFIHPDMLKNSRLVMSMGPCWVPFSDIYGGRSGSHSLGHSEPPWNHLDWIERSGYIPLTVAKERGIISPDWRPPED